MSAKNAPENNDRRKVLKKLAIGSAAVAGCSVLPKEWISPVVEFGALPAHAVTSGTTYTQSNTTTTQSITETGRYSGRHNGDRPTWYFSKKMAEYPDSFTIEVAGCTTVTVTGNNGHRYVEGATIVKQSDVAGRGMAVITSSGCSSATCYCHYK